MSVTEGDLIKSISSWIFAIVLCYSNHPRGANDGTRLLFFKLHVSCMSVSATIARFFIVTAENPPSACGGDESATRNVGRRSRLVYNKVCPDASPNTPPSLRGNGFPRGGDEGKNY